jgi:hypothetical protein
LLHLAPPLNARKRKRGPQKASAPDHHGAVSAPGDHRARPFGTARILELVKERIPGKLRLDPILDVQVLCPMDRGSLGARAMNVFLPDGLNPRRGDEPMVERFGWQFRLRDKVIQTENNYDKEVFNGDIGQVVSIDPEEARIANSLRGAGCTLRFQRTGRAIAGLRHHNP